jgi:hypothetical protein
MEMRLEKLPHDEVFGHPGRPLVGHAACQAEPAYLRAEYTLVAEVFGYKYVRLSCHKLIDDHEC